MKQFQLNEYYLYEAESEDFKWIKTFEKLWLNSKI